MYRDRTRCSMRAVVLLVACGWAINFRPAPAVSYCTGRGLLPCCHCLHPHRRAVVSDLSCLISSLLLSSAVLSPPLLFHLFSFSPLPSILYSLFTFHSSRFTPFLSSPLSLLSSPFLPLLPLPSSLWLFPAAAETPPPLPGRAPPCNHQSGAVAECNPQMTTAAGNGPDAAVAAMAAPRR